jgi:hypothetical protein
MLMKPIANSGLAAIPIPINADRGRGEAAPNCSYHGEVIGIRQSIRGRSEAWQGYVGRLAPRPCYLPSVWESIVTKCST